MGKLKLTRDILYISWALCSMIWCRVSFGELISIIACAPFPVNVYVILSFFVTEPMETHVPRFRTSLMGIIVNIPYSCRVINLYECRWLRMFKSNKEASDWDRSLRIMEEGTYVSFSCRGDYMFDCFAFNLKGAISVGRIFCNCELKNPAIRLRALGRTRYEASELTLRIILLAW